MKYEDFMFQFLIGIINLRKNLATYGAVKVFQFLIGIINLVRKAIEKTYTGCFNSS